MMMRMREEHDEVLVKGRGGEGKFAVEVIPSNFIILYGTKPGKMVSLDT